MPDISRWSQSMTNAWEYALAGLRSGLSQTEALAQYRGGGGAIRDSSWSSIWHSGETLGENTDFIIGMPKDWTIPESRFTPIGWASMQPYVTQVQISFFDQESKQWRQEWRTLEFDQRPTGDELNAAIRDQLINAYANRAGSGWALLDISAYHTGAETFEEE
jgi:hypothetical protein